MEKKSQAINFLLTGLHIHTDESKARGPRNALPSVGYNVGPWALYSPVQIRKPVSKKIVLKGQGRSCDMKNYVVFVDKEIEGVTDLSAKGVCWSGRGISKQAQY